MNRTKPILVVGAGGLGSAILMPLAAEGVSSITVVDSDKVEPSNLNRQILHRHSRLGWLKVHSAQIQLRKHYPSVSVNCNALRVDENNAAQLVGDASIVVDGTDNFETRFWLNDACIRLGVPFVHAGVLALFGQAFTIIPNQTPCYRCVFEGPPEPGLVPTARELGILGAVAGLFGAVQAGEVLALLRGQRPSLAGKLWAWDGGSSGEVRTINLGRRPSCPVCLEEKGPTAPPDRSETTEAAMEPREDNTEPLPIPNGADDANRTEPNLPKMVRPEPLEDQFSRNMLVPQIGREGQAKLGLATVRVQGTDRGAITASLYLVAAGIGTLVLDHCIPMGAQDLQDLNPDCQVVIERQNDTNRKLPSPPTWWTADPSQEPPLPQVTNLPEAQGALAAFNTIMAILHQ